MITKNEQSVNTENAVECEFGNAIRELGISGLLKKSNIRKKKSGSVFDIFRFLNESSYDWKRFLTLLAVRVTNYFNSLTKPGRVI